MYEEQKLDIYINEDLIIKDAYFSVLQNFTTDLNYYTRVKARKVFNGEDSNYDDNIVSIYNIIESIERNFKSCKVFIDGTLFLVDYISCCLDKDFVFYCDYKFCILFYITFVRQKEIKSIVEKKFSIIKNRFEILDL